MRFETYVAARYLRGKRKNRFVSLITAISVAGVCFSFGRLFLLAMIATCATSCVPLAMSWSLSRPHTVRDCGDWDLVKRPNEFEEFANLSYVEQLCITLRNVWRTHPSIYEYEQYMCDQGLPMLEFLIGRLEENDPQMSDEESVTIGKVALCILTSNQEATVLKARTRHAIESSMPLIDTPRKRQWMSEILAAIPD